MTRRILCVLLALLASCGNDECKVAEDCPGTEGDCLTKVCSSGKCEPMLAAAGTLVAMQTNGDCHTIQCDGNGNAVSVVDDQDVADDSNPCTVEACTKGVASKSLADPATACGSGLECDADGHCVSCINWTQCPGQDNECEQRTCSQQGVCGFTFAMEGKTRTLQIPKDCHKIVCDGQGMSETVVDDTDLPNDNNPCTTDICTNGTASHGVVNAGTACGTGLECDGAGHCVNCIMASECPGTDTECHMRTCVAGVCGAIDPPLGTAISTQTSGDCKLNVCDGSGGFTVQNDDGDPFVDGNVCTQDLCSMGTPENPPVLDGTSCDTNGGTCSAGTCEPAFFVVRVGDGTTAPTAAATAVFLEKRAFDGTLLTTISLPTAVSGANLQCTLSGTANAEGQLQLSSDGRFATLGCYAAALGTANVSTSPDATVNRVAARLDATGAVDTSTALATAFDGQPVRSAFTTDGTAFWLAGGTTGAANGVFATTFGATGGEVQVLAAPNAPRVVSVFGGQLYSDSPTAGFQNVFSIGTGTPTTAGQTATPLPGLTTSGNGLFGYALLDRIPAVPGVDTLYLANDNALPTGGVTKWTFDGANWALASTFTNGLTTGVRGLAAFVSNGTVVVVAVTTQSTVNSIVMLVDDGSANPMWKTLATAGTNTAYRGVAVAPH